LSFEDDTFEYINVIDKIGTVVFTPSKEKVISYIAIEMYSNTFNNETLQIQVEDGSVATDWQYPYGAIVHEKDVLKDFWSGTTQNVWTTLVFSDNLDLLNNYAFYRISNRNIEKTSEGLVIKKTGYYYIDFNVSVERTDASLSNLYVVVLQNGTELIARQNKGATNVIEHFIGSSGIVKLNSGDKITVVTTRDNSGITGYIHDLNFTIKEI
jgi:hypothetical protein